ncbi:MAG: hypothetical protein ACT4RN_22350 [Pseudonocardia sp.]
MVRSIDEIVATLDESGEYESLPFMPEMAAFCGRRMVVAAVAHKLCDTIERSGFRRMHGAVHLRDARCDGAAHGGCETECLLYWKQAWLRRVEPTGPDPVSAPVPGPVPVGTRIDLPLLAVNTRREPGPDGAPRYRCQATEILRAAPTALPLRDLGQYVDDVRSRNVRARSALRAFLVGLFNAVQRVSTARLPRALWFRGGRRWLFLSGGITAGRTPTAALDLQPGELVRIKDRETILATVDAKLLNRGLGFDEEMSVHCGRIARVRRRAERVVDERTGELLIMRNPCIVLDDVVCEGGYSRSCPRAFYSFWREIWLERVPAGTPAPAPCAAALPRAAPPA